MISVLPVLVSIWAAVVLVVGYVSLSRFVRRGSKLPPGNKGWPLIGEFFSLLKPYPTTERGEFMENRLSRFGKIFSSNLLGKLVVISVDAEMNRFILTKDIAMFEPGWPAPLTKLFGQMALILLVGDAHKNLRSIYLHFLSSERLRTVFFPNAQRTASWLLGSWINGSLISAKDEANKEEHRQIIRSKPPSGERMLTWDDYKAMEFTQCVINETLRMGCVAPYLYQKASADFQFKGYVIPRGCTVMTHISAVHLDPALFEDPQHFNPWRWLGPTGLKKPNEFMPFGGGARLCPGRYLARLEMAIFLHHLILKYDWELVEPDHPMSFPLPDFPKGLWIKVQALSTE